MVHILVVKQSAKYKDEDETHTSRTSLIRTSNAGIILLVALIGNISSYTDGLVGETCH